MQTRCDTCKVMLINRLDRERGLCAKCFMRVGKRVSDERVVLHG